MREGREDKRAWLWQPWPWKPWPWKQRPWKQQPLGEGEGEVQVPESPPRTWSEVDPGAGWPAPPPPPCVLTGIPCDCEGLAQASSSGKKPQKTTANHRGTHLGILGFCQRLRLTRGLVPLPVQRIASLVPPVRPPSEEDTQVLPPALPRACPCPSPPSAPSLPLPLCLSWPFSQMRGQSCSEGARR